MAVGQPFFTYCFQEWLGDSRHLFLNLQFDGDIPYAVAWTPGWNQAVHAVTDIVCQQGTLHAACIHLTPDAWGPLETEEEFHLLVLGADQWQAQWSG